MFLSKVLPPAQIASFVRKSRSSHLGRIATATVINLGKRGN